MLPLTSRTAVLLVDLRIVVVGEDVLAVGDEVFQILVGNSHGVFTIGREGLNHKTKIKVLISLIVMVSLRPESQNKNQSTDITNSHGVFHGLNHEIKIKVLTSLIVIVSFTGLNHKTKIKELTTLIVMVYFTA